MSKKGFYSALAVNAFNQGNDQQALQYATLGYDGSVQNIQSAIQQRNMERQLKQQQEEMQRQADESRTQTEQQANQNQKQRAQNVRRENSGKNSQNLTQGQSSSGTWIKRALGGDNANNSEEWY
uniref:hypothetical protein n=1 Tax=Succinivibrio sp. TaxID=2053619 RepID=UPI00402AD74A